MSRGTGTQPAIDYGEVRELLTNYYKLKNPAQSQIPLQLEDYFLNGRQIIGLMDGLIKLHPEYIKLEDDLEKVKKITQNLEENLIEIRNQSAKIKKECESLEELLKDALKTIKKAQSSS
mgnify:CR=1 FL=1